MCRSREKDVCGKREREREIKKGRVVVCVGGEKKRIDTHVNVDKLRRGGGAIGKEEQWVL